MKKTLIAALVLTAAASPLRAQENIEKLYQRMASDPKVEVSQSIQVDRKPGADVAGKTSVCEINEFFIKKPHKKGLYAERLENYVTDIANAIQAEASNPQCYRIASYREGKGEQPRQWNLLYGDDASQYVSIGKNRGKNYIFVCFTDKQAPGYRWCYALEWWGWSKSYMQGRFMRLYAKMPEETTSEPKYKASVSYDDEDDPFTMFGGGQFGMGLVINAKDRTFTLNGKTLPLDSLTSQFAQLKEISPLEAELQTGGLVTAIMKHKATRTERYLQSFSALSARWMRCDYETDPTLPVSIYSLVKEAVEADMFSKDEKEMLSSQLASMVADAEGKSAEATNACNYLILAQKIIKRSLDD